MAEGVLKIKITDEIIQNEILPKDEFENQAQAITAIFKWAVPHWDWARNLKIGAIKMHPDMASKFIGRIDALFPTKKMETAMQWVNFGPSARDRIEMYVLEINFSLIDYSLEKEEM